MSAICSETRGPSLRRVRWLLRWPGVVVAYWKRREMIRTLQEMNDHQLRDIGLMRHQIEDVVNGVADPDIVRLW